MGSTVNIMPEDLLLNEEDQYQQLEDDDLRETLNKHLNETEHDKKVVHKINYLQQKNEKIFKL